LTLNCAGHDNGVPVPSGGGCDSLDGDGVGGGGVGAPPAPVAGEVVEGGAPLQPVEEGDQGVEGTVVGGIAARDQAGPEGALPHPEGGGGEAVVTEARAEGIAQLVGRHQPGVGSPLVAGRPTQ